MNFHGGYWGNEAYIDYSVNIPPLAYEETFKRLLISEIDHLFNYPEINGASLCKSLAKQNQLAEGQIILGNGATELIYLYARTFKYENVMIIEPTFTEYRRAFDLTETTIHTFELDKENQFHLEAKSLVKAIKATQSDCLILCNPNNPTGQLYDLCDLEWVLNECPKLNILIDESFIEFVDKEYQLASANFMNVSHRMDRIMRLRSMTKIYAIPGLRLGYAIGGQEAIAKMMAFKEPWTINQMALAAGIHLVEESSYDQVIYEWCQAERLYMKEALLKMKAIEVYEGQANFLLIKVEEALNPLFRKQLKADKIYLRTCVDFKGLNENYYRIALKQHEENAFLINKLKEILYDEIK